MRNCFALLCLCILAVNAAHIWPLPSKFTQSGDSMTLASNFVILANNKTEVLDEAIKRYTGIIGQSHFDNGLSKLVINVKDLSDTLGFDTDYSYTLSVNEQAATIEANTSFGALYGLESFSQLIKDFTFDHSNYEVEDFPVYKHRGIMIDTGRRFFPVSTVKMILESMPFNKLNVLHFHLSDWGRVAVESKIYPQLTAELVGERGGFYTQDEIRELVAYAKLRGVRIIPEIDIPGHCLGFKPLSAVGMQFCDSSMKQLYDDPEGRTFNVLSTYLGEILPLFPEPFVHLGCDETEKIGVCDVQSAASLEKKIFKFVYETLGKRPIAWEESLFIKKSMIPEGVINTWTSHIAVEALNAGFDAVENSNKHFYIDYIWRSYKDMWVHLSEKDAVDEHILFGGEVSMWTDNWCNTRQCGSAAGDPPVGHELFDPKHNKEFEEAIMSVIYPRTIVAAGTFWRYDASLDVNSDEFSVIYDEANNRLMERHIISCPLECKCDEISKCGKKYLDN